MPSADKPAKKTGSGRQVCNHQFKVQGGWRVCTKCGFRKPNIQTSPG